MNSDTVKPMPPSTATPAMWRSPSAVGERADARPAPRASTRRRCRRTCRRRVRRRCRSSPGSTSAWSMASPLSTTPALASAKIGTITKLDTGCSAVLESLEHRDAAPRARRREQPEHDAGERRLDPGLVEAPPQHDAGDHVRERMVDTEARHHDDEQPRSRRRRASHHAVETARVEERDHDDGADVVDDREREQEQLQARRHARAEQGEHARPRTRCRSPSGSPSRRGRRRRG